MNDVSSIPGFVWHEILEALPALAFAFAPSGEVTYVNQYFRAYAGSDATVSAGRAWSTALHPEDHAPVVAGISAGRDAGTSFRLVQRIRRLDGSYRPFEALLVPLRDALGEIAQWVGVESDVENYLQIVARLEDTEARMRLVLDTIPQIIWTADASGWIDWYNPRWYAYTGQTEAEAAGWGWQAAHHPDDFPKVMERWPESIRTGRPFDMEFRLRGADGQFRWMLTRVVPSRNAAGDVVRWFGSNTDIEEQKRAEQRSRRVASILQEALLPDRIPTVDGLSLDALYMPAESDALIGGDWYDAITLADGRILISCGDVTGHGLEAAATAARLRHMIAFAGREDAEPATVLARVNAVLLAEDGALATAAVAMYDPATLAIRFALAGHPPPIVGRVGAAARTVAPGGMPLGTSASAEFATQQLSLARGDLFVLYTDGLTEFDRDLERAERDLHNVVTVLAADPTIADPARFIRDEIMRTGDRRDDVAIFVLRLTQPGAPATPRAMPLRRTWRFHSSHALSAHNARIEVASYLSALATDPQAVGEAELVVGELLANTVEHAPGLVELSVDWCDRTPLLVVRDSGSGTATLRGPALPDVLSENGRGLFLVQALADDVTITGTPTVGTEVSCRLRLERDIAFVGA